MSGRPDPAGAMPGDWRPIEWAAFLALSGGASYREAGESVGRARGTISGWVQRWRAKYGPEFCPVEGKTTLSPETRGPGSSAAGAVTAARWREVRELAAGRFGAVSEVALQHALDIMADIMADKDRRASLTMADVATLARVADLAARRADALADVVDPTRAFLGAPGGPGAGGRGGSLLDGLELPTGPAGGETLEMLEMVSTRFRHLVAVDAGSDIVDVAGRAAG